MCFNILSVLRSLKKDSNCNQICYNIRTYLKCDANVLAILVGYFMNFRIRIYQNGYLKKKRDNKKHISVETEASLHLCAIYVETERTYCFTTVCNKTRCLLEGFLEVMFESFILVLFGAQLHEFTWIDWTKIHCI